MSEQQPEVPEGVVPNVGPDAESGLEHEDLPGTFDDTEPAPGFHDEDGEPIETEGDRNQLEDAPKKKKG